MCLQLRHFGQDCLPAWHELAWAMRTGNSGSAFEKAFGQPMWRYLESHPKQELNFSAAMACLENTGTLQPVTAAAS